MSMRPVILMLVLVLCTALRSGAQPPPTHNDFRPLTFSTPSPAMSQFYHGRGNYGHGANVIVAPYVGGYSYSGYGYSGYSSYYDSVIGNYGASPFNGLDASTSLYTRPVRNLIYAPGVPSQRIGFYESTIPYGDYRLRAGSWGR